MKFPSESHEMLTPLALDIPRADARYQDCVTLGHQLTLALMHEVAAVFPEASATEQIRLALMILHDSEAVPTHAGHLFVEMP